MTKAVKVVVISEKKNDKSCQIQLLPLKTNPKGHSNNFPLTQYNYNDSQSNLQLKLQQTYVCVDNENTYILASLNYNALMLVFFVKNKNKKLLLRVQDDNF